MTALVQSVLAQPIRIVVDGSPIGKARPRFVRATGHTFTPKKTVNYEALIRFEASAAMRGYPPYDGPVVVRVTAMMPVPTSWSKRKQAEALEGAVRPGKPDADNLLKLVADALNTVVYGDDKQIAEARISKLYDADPRLEIEIEPVSVRAPKVEAA